jgi:hypothetical protein
MARVGARLAYLAILVTSEVDSAPPERRLHNDLEAIGKTFAIYVFASMKSKCFGRILDLLSSRRE